MVVDAPTDTRPLLPAPSMDDLDRCANRQIKAMVDEVQILYEPR